MLLRELLPASDKSGILLELQVDSRAHKASRFWQPSQTPGSWNSSPWSFWKKVRCGGLNLLGPGSYTIRRHDLVQAGMALLEEVYHCGSGL